VVWSLAAVIVLAGAGAALFFNERTPASPPALTGAPAQPAVDTLPRDGVIAYYFHTNYRCTSCRKIEAYSKVAIESGFDAELAGGRLQFRLVNVEDPGNDHFVQDYKLYTKALVLSERVNGREVRWTNLSRVWELLNDEPAFVDYVQKETRAFLAEAP
jgi:hypothetical protein